MELIPIILISIIIWLFVRGRKRLNNKAPHCDRCGTKMTLVHSNPAYRHQADPANPWSQYGRTLWKYRCPNCYAEKIV